MNLYLIVSESLETVEWEDRECYAGHIERYCICELAVARSHGHARFMAWKHDDPDGTYPWFKDMPKFAVRLKKRDVPGPARIIMYDDDAPWLDEIEGLFSVGCAPNIGIIEVKESIVW